MVCVRKGCGCRMKIVVDSFTPEQYSSPDCKGAPDAVDVRAGEVAAKPPGIAARAKSLKSARDKWIEAGKPMRPPERVAEILAICQACKHFNPGKPITMAGGLVSTPATCTVCGCWLKNAPLGLVTKIEMATESCPLSTPKWTADV